VATKNRLKETLTEIFFKYMARTIRFKNYRQIKENTGIFEKLKVLKLGMGL